MKLNRDTLLLSLGNLPDDLVLEALSSKGRSQRACFSVPRKLRWAIGLAACLCVALLLPYFLGDSGGSSVFVAQAADELSKTDPTVVTLFSNGEALCDENGTWVGKEEGQIDITSITYSYLFTPQEENPSQADVELSFTVKVGSVEYPMTASGVVDGYPLTSGRTLWEGPIEGTSTIDGVEYSILLSFSKLSGDSSIQLSGSISRDGGSVTILFGEDLLTDEVLQEMYDYAEQHEDDPTDNASTGSSSEHMIEPYDGEILSYEETDEGLTFELLCDDLVTRTCRITDETKFWGDEKETLEAAISSREIGLYVFVLCEWDTIDFDGTCPIVDFWYSDYWESVTLIKVQSLLDPENAEAETLHVTADGFEKDESVQTLCGLLESANWADPLAYSSVSYDEEPLFTVTFEEGYGIHVYETFVCVYDVRENLNGALCRAYYALPEAAAEAVAAYAAESTGNSKATGANAPA